MVMIISTTRTKSNAHSAGLDIHMDVKIRWMRKISLPRTSVYFQWKQQWISL